MESTLAMKARLAYRAQAVANMLSAIAGMAQAQAEARVAAILAEAAAVGVTVNAPANATLTHDEIFETCLKALANGLTVNVGASPIQR